MSAPAREFTAWFIELDCGGRQCARGRVYEIAGLVGVYRPETVIGMVQRLRCTVCGAAPSGVALWSDLPSCRTLRTRRIVLRGRDLHLGD